MYQIKTSQISIIRKLLVNSFLDDDAFTTIIHNEARRYKFLNQYFHFLLHYYINFNAIYSLDCSLTSIVIYSSDQAIHLKKLLKIKGAFLFIIRNLKFLFKLTQNQNKENKLNNRIYIHFLAVKKNLRNFGLGSRLLKEVMMQVDIPIVLQTTSKKAKKFYERNHFICINNNNNHYLMQYIRDNMG